MTLWYYIIHFQAKGWAEDSLSLEYAWSTEEYQARKPNESNILKAVSDGKSMSVSVYEANSSVGNVIAT